MDELVSFFKLKSKGPLDYFLGNDYRIKENGMWATSSKKYIHHAIPKVEDIYGVLAPASSPAVKSDYPELDLTPLLNTRGYRDY